MGLCNAHYFISLDIFLFQKHSGPPLDANHLAELQLLHNQHLHPQGLHQISSSPPHLQVSPSSLCSPQHSSDHNPANAVSVIRVAGSSRLHPQLSPATVEQDFQKLKFLSPCPSRPSTPSCSGSQSPNASPPSIPGILSLITCH